MAIENPSGSGYGSSVTCHATLVFADGATQSGLLSFTDPGGAAPLSVNWQPDANAQLPDTSPPVPFAASPVTKRAIQRICATSPGMRCSAFISIAAQCEQLGGDAFAYYAAYAMWRSKGLSSTEATNYASQYPTDPLVAEMAAQAPVGTTPQAFRENMLRQCLAGAEK